MISKEELKVEVKEVLNVFLESDETVLNFDQLSYGILRECLEELQWKKDPDCDFDTMGWEIDFWVDFIREELRLAISGSLWYGDITIDKNY